MSNRQQLRNDELKTQMVDFMRDATLNLRAAEVSLREYANINKPDTSAWVQLGMVVAARKSIEQVMEIKR